MKKSLLLASAILSASVSNTALSAIIQIQDSDFVAWSSFSFVTDDPFTSDSQPGTSSGNAVTVATGGNSGAFLEVTHEIVYGDTVWTGGIKTDASYDPSLEGAIDYLSFGADLISPDGNSTAWQLVVEQGGQQYFSFPLLGYSDTSWNDYGLLELTAANFDTNPWADRGGITPDGNQPDFGSTGSSLQFGFMFGNRLTGPGVLSNTMGLDNFRVDIETSVVPIPAAVWLFGSGLIGLTAVARRKLKLA
ncbi:MAG: VPLPA-CTERM sorting domain-containing protein [Gammaproteobacteria bacterium]|nr:VPLPA-CTERM sorting domain-containing protein [Gammaproteobacteria bacterium]MCK5091975.1 VPLPA-CTERM sorting domain-containing protein [Gammaproteobacteria bacterium]